MSDLILDASYTDVTTQSAGYKVDPTRGANISKVSSQWFSRPSDQRFNTLAELHHSVMLRKLGSTTRVIESKDIRVDVDGSDPESLKLMSPGLSDAVNATHWSFGQVATAAGCPASYLRDLQARPGGNRMAGMNLQFGLATNRSEQLKLYYNHMHNTLLAANGPDYGRIYDAEVVEAVMRMVDRSGGIWKVPGTLDWATNIYDPNDIGSTTLFASDRDVFLFMVDDTHPIEIGKLKDGSPDMVFRGFIVWNSEVGSKTFGLMTFLLRAVCMNRNIWGAQDISELVMRHSKNAPARFAAEAAPRLLTYANQSAMPILAGLNAAKATVVATKDEDRLSFLRNQGFGKSESQSILDLVVETDEKPAESIFDFVQGITAYAKRFDHQDRRVALEQKAGKLLDKAARRA